MAKRKKNNKGNVDNQPASEPSASDAYVERVQNQFDIGSYAGVNRLAHAAPADLDGAAKAKLDEVVGMTKIDPVQLAIGAGGLLLVIIVGLLTLS